MGKCQCHGDASNIYVAILLRDAGLACTKDQTRHFLWTRQKEERANADLKDREIDWIMRIEGNETCILSWQKNKDDDSTPASGGQWMLKRGQTATLAWLCWWSREHITCYEAYREWLKMPICCYKRYHSESHTVNSTFRRNARFLQFFETGCYGLNSKPSRSKQPRDN